MMSLVVVGLVAFLAWNWVRLTRLRRQQWLARLQLPGIWEAEGEVAESLSLQGSLSAGEFRSSRLGTGHWRLSGHTLTLDTGSQVHAFDLTFHDAGRIGLEAGPGRRRVFVRRTSNVVPLRRANR